MPSKSAHNLKNRQGIKSYSQPSCCGLCKRAAHLEPNNDQIPKSNHAQICRTIPFPCGRIFDGNHVHGMQHALHREEAEEKPDGIGDLIFTADRRGIADLTSISSARSTLAEFSLPAI
jgi:hypothetical protein